MNMAENDSQRHDYKTDLNEERTQRLSLVEESAYYWKRFPDILWASESIKENEPTIVDLFCGLGGFSIGFEWAGFQTVLGLDIHKPSVETFRRTHPRATVILGDVRKS